MREVGVSTNIDHRGSDDISIAVQRREINPRPTVLLEHPSGIDLLYTVLV